MAKTKGVKQCKPPNKKCGKRCIPPTWSCRLKGEGGDSHLKAAGKGSDPLAAIANIQRGTKRIQRGVLRGNPSEIEGGRRAVIRGVVKGSKGNLQEKKELQNKLISKTVSVSAVFGVVGLGVGAHRALSVSPSYKRTVGRKITETFNTVEDTILNNMPFGAGRARRERQAAAQGIAVNFGKRTVTAPFGGDMRRGVGELTTPIYSASSKLAREVKKVKPGDYGNDFDKFRADSITAYFGARTKDGNIHAQLSAQDMLRKEYGLNLDLSKGFDLHQRSLDVRRALTESLSLERHRLFENAKHRGIKLNDDESRSAYAQFLIKGTGLNSAQEATAISTVNQLLKTSPNAVADNIYNDYIRRYDKFYEGVSEALTQQYTDAGNVRRSSVALPLKYSDIIETARVKHAEYLDKLLSTGNNQQANKRVYGPHSADLTVIMYFDTKAGAITQGKFSAAKFFVSKVWREIKNNAPERLNNPSDEISIEDKYSQLSKLFPGLTVPAGATYLSGSATIEGRRRARRRRAQIRNKVANQKVTKVEAKVVGTEPQKFNEAINTLMKKKTKDGRLVYPNKLAAIRAYFENRARLRRATKRGFWTDRLDNLYVKLDSQKGKKCGNSYISKKFTCQRGRVQESNTERKSKLRRNIATAVVAGTVGVLAVAAAHDAYQLSKGFDLPATPSMRTAAKPFMKESDGLQDSLSKYYDQRVKEGNWKAGDLVYSRDKNDSIGHFAVYLGKKDNAHNFARVEVQHKYSKFGAIEITKVGKDVERREQSRMLFDRAPTNRQPKSRYSESEVQNRINDLIGKRINFNHIDANCEHWANMIASGRIRSTQVERLTAVSKLLSRSYSSIQANLNPKVRKQAGRGLDIRAVARWLENNDPRNIDHSYSALIKKNRKYRNDTEDAFMGLISPSEVIKSRMSDLEAISAIKRWLMVFTTALAMANGAN